MTPDLFTPRQATETKDAVLHDVEQAYLPWFEKALRIITRLRWELNEFSGEDIRHEIEARLIEQAPGSHVWGALVNTALQRGLIVPTGKRVRMLDKKANGRKTDVYRPGSGK